MGILSATAKSKIKFIPANLSSTLVHRFPCTTAALAPNLKQHDNTNKNLMLMVRVLNVMTCDHCVISTENNSFRVVSDTLHKLSLLRAENFYTGHMNADYIVQACSNYKWMLLACQKVPGPPYDLLWDPKTDETKPLPLSAIGSPLPFPIFSLGWGVGVGFDPSGDYKVVKSQLFVYEGYEFRIRSKVLSLRTGSWKEIPYPYDPKFKPIENRALHINGFYYWLARHLNSKTYAIIPFDFANEKFPPALIPMLKSQKNWSNARVVPAEFHGSLAALAYSFSKREMEKPCFEIWVWENDNWSFVEEFEVPADCDALHRIIGLYKNDKVLIQDSNGDLLLYDCATRSLKNLGIHDDSLCLEIYPYGITRRSPTIDNDEDSNKVEKFKEMKRTKLEELAKSKGLKGYSNMNKSRLAELLASNGV